jgi:hypothetical protein
MLKTDNTSAIVRMYNTTGMVSYVGEVNVSNLQRPLFKPFIAINSEESYLTRDFAAYKAAKNQSEIIRPSTKIFEVKAPSTSNYSKISLHNDEEQWPASHRTNSNRYEVLFGIRERFGLSLTMAVLSLAIQRVVLAFA